MLLVLSGISCNDDFLSKNQIDLYSLSDTLELNNLQSSVSVPVQLPVLADCDYTILMQPKWLSFKTMHGKVTNGNFVLEFDIIKNDLISGYQTYNAMLMINIEDLGIVSLEIIYTNNGTPTLDCSVASLNYESLDARTLTIKNTTDGILKWEISGKPDWLHITPMYGSLLKNQYTNLSVSLNHDLLDLEHEHSGSFLIKSNSATGTLTIPVHVDAIVIESSETQYINGIVTDAEYNQQAGIMAIVAKSPDKLYIFNTNTNKTDTLPLPEAPNCISISEDGHNAVIGFSTASVSYLDLDKPEILKSFDIEFDPFDIALGENGWCYLTTSAGDFEDLRNLNLVSGEVIKTSDSFAFSERSRIKKIPGKPYLIGIRTWYSPSGLYLFDLTKGKASDTVSYYHISIDRFWISKDGTRIFTAYGDIYKIPEYDGQMHVENPDNYGHIDYSILTALDECPDSNSIFFTSNVSDAVPQVKQVIEQYDLSTLTSIRTYSTSPVYLYENGTRVLYDTSPKYIFVKKDGSDLYILKNIREYYNKNFWAIEVFHPGNKKKGIEP